MKNKKKGVKNKQIETQHNDQENLTKRKKKQMIGKQVPEVQELGLLQDVG